MMLNKKMTEEYKKILLNNNELNSELSNLIDYGFENKNGCFFLKKLVNIDTNVTIKDFSDRTGYECFFNSLNIDDYVNEKYLEQGILFVINLFNKWNFFNKNNELVAILSLDEFGLKIKFHVNREEEQWLSQDLDAFEEAILIVNSSDQKFKNVNLIKQLDYANH